MKKNGFTLIEVLSVVILLGIIAIIFVPEAVKILSSNEAKIYKTKETMVEKASEDYILEHKEFVLPDASNPTKYITINTLVENNYIAKVLAADSGNECNGFVKITVNQTYGYNYEACLLCENYVTNKDFCTTTTYNNI